MTQPSRIFKQIIVWLGLFAHLLTGISSVQAAVSPNSTISAPNSPLAQVNVTRVAIDSVVNRDINNNNGNTTDNEQQYLDLLNAGVMYAKQFNLSPGIALSAEQMAALTTDIVWLQSQTITLADGSCPVRCPISLPSTNFNPIF